MKNVSESSTQYEYEGFVEVFPNVQSVSTNTIHVPMRRGSLQSLRPKDWTQTAKQLLTEEHCVDKSKLRTREERIKRMSDDVTGYYRRRKATKETIKRKVLGIVDEFIMINYGLKYLLSLKKQVHNRKCN